MQELVVSAKRCIETENRYAALAVLLTLPDICAALEIGGQVTGHDYQTWCKRFVVPIYLARYNVEFPENEIWALRCAFLHQGSGEVHLQRSSTYFRSYRFVLPKKGWTFATRKVRGDDLLIEIKTFCTVLVEAAEIWIETVLNKDEAVRARSQSGILMMTDGGTDGVPP